MDARRIKALAANRHRTFRCVECGERYGYDWVYEYGLRCDAGCDGELVEVRNGS
jgi:transcription initiation factor IIE alpha subunit